MANGEAGALGIVGAAGVGRRLARQADRDVETRTIVTAYGSVDVVVGKVDGAPFAAAEKSPAAPFAPHNIPYRAFVLALKRAGATRLLSTSVGTGVREALRIGDVVIPSDSLDLSGRSVTFYGGGIEPTHHASMEAPFCERLSREYVSTARGFGLRFIQGGTVATLPGPHHPTAPELDHLTSSGVAATSFTAATEAKLAREVGMCFAMTLVVVRMAPPRAAWRQATAATTPGGDGEPTEAELLSAFARGQDAPAHRATARAPATSKAARASRSRDGQLAHAEDESKMLREIDERLEEAAAAFVAQAAALPPCSICPSGAGPSIT